MNVYCEAAKEMAKTILVTALLFGGLALGIWCLINYALYTLAGIVVLFFVGWFFSTVDDLEKERARRDFLKPKGEQE